MNYTKCALGGDSNSGPANFRQEQAVQVRILRGPSFLTHIFHITKYLNNYFVRTALVIILAAVQCLMLVRSDHSTGQPKLGPHCRDVMAQDRIPTLHAQASTQRCTLDTLFNKYPARTDTQIHACIHTSMVSVCSCCPRSRGS